MEAPKQLSVLRYCVIVFILTLVCSIAATVYCYKLLNQPLQAVLTGSVIRVEPGASFDSVLSDLARNSHGVELKLIKIYSILRGISRKVQVGEYIVVNGMSLAQLLQNMLDGRRLVYHFTIIEGWNIYQLTEALALAPGLIHTIKDDSLSQIWRAYSGSSKSPEGLFFADTYAYSYPDTDLDILQRAAKTMRQYLSAVYEKYQCERHFPTRYEALVAASLIEKETANPKEMRLISGVIQNRLRHHYYLGIDAAVRYGVRNFSKPLYRSELQAMTPYNTYRIKGLPPTPIAIPSSQALLAACDPAQPAFLYYVAIDGYSHHFSKTLQEHNKAVAKYRR